jgi:DNA repair protein RadC
VRLEAAFELGRRVEEARWSPGEPVRSPGGVERLMAPRLRGLERETFHALLLDGRHRLLEAVQVSEGTLTTSLVHPREVFLPALRHPAAALIVVHNHPSGDPEPSSEDLAVTRRLADCGRLLGIPLIDHVVLGEGRSVSIRGRIEF